MNVAPGPNQTPPFVDIDLFKTDIALGEAMVRAGCTAHADALSRFGTHWGSGAQFELGRLANVFAPELQAFDARGERRDEVLFHPAYHALMRDSTSAGLHASTWDGESHSLRAARLYMAYQVEAGHICPMTMTHAAGAVLCEDAAVAGDWMPLIRRRSYDPHLRPWWEKSGVTLGMGMTERQGGSDVRSNETRAHRTGDHYEITGEKWFMSAPMCDAFLVLAQAPDGLTCLLVPRFRPDGSRNTIELRRLKDKLGNRSNASAEVEFAATHGARIGEEGAGVRTILRMVQLTRVDCAVASAGLMRFGLAQAVHHARHRVAFGKPLASQPAMRRLLADLALEVEALTALVFRVVRAIDRAATDPDEAEFARLLVPAAKYLVCKSAPGFITECMECLGGNGYSEDWPLARAYREAPVNAIWEGSGNIIALDVLRAAARSPASTQALVARIAGAGQCDAGDLGVRLVAPDCQGEARALSEALARLAATAALGEVDEQLAQAHARVRLAGPSRGCWGTAPLGGLEDRLLARVLPR